MVRVPMKLYSFFHLNLAYSSIEIEQRPDVIRHCYWPLLHLAREYNLPFGIEASGYTLESIAAIDPAWVEELRLLTAKGPCEMIGSGYAQIIGPLVPAEVNQHNLQLGNKVYQRLLGFRPSTALISEQAYSAGLIQHYLDAGYQAIIMEWDNPASCHREWDPEWRYLPQYACGYHGEKIPLIWNNSIAFQKFQRYAHGEMELDNYFSYLREHLSRKPRAFPLYGNDVEIFDFRPGRYHTEPVLREEAEWQRIRSLFEALSDEGGFQFIRPSQVLDLLHEPEAGHCLHLESPEQPIPVKKQGKYNVTRWAVTGRDDLEINTACWRIYEKLKSNAAADEQWQELCYLWSSDFRTHITESRWQQYKERLKVFQQQLGLIPVTRKKSSQNVNDTVLINDVSGVKREGKILHVETGHVRVRLNCGRGLTIDSLWLGSKEGPPVCGTLAHGYYGDINLGADWYTGHTVMEILGQPKVADLNPVDPEIRTTDTRDVMISGAVITRLGTLKKSVIVSAARPEIELNYVFDWPELPLGSFRLGYITLNPEAFDRSKLQYRTCNGGYQEEVFPLAKTDVDHGRAVSFLVSANCCLGLTSGWVELGDDHRLLRVEIDSSEAALVGLIKYYETGDTFFCRLILSAGEVDETCRPRNNTETIKCRIKLKLRQGS